MIQIDIANHQRLLKFDRRRLRQAARQALAVRGVRSAEISIAVVDDATIRELNRRYLRHDYATDVLSFVLDSDDGHLDGEVIVSAETASRAGRELGVPADHELLLYLIHGTLHLVGFDDKTPAAARRMRTEQRRILDQFVSPAAAGGTEKRPHRVARAQPRGSRR